MEIKYIFSGFRNILKGSVRFFSGLPDRFGSYILLLSRDRRARFRLIVWAYSFIFFGVSLLSSSNPFRLLVPGSVFYVPVRDARKKVEVFGIARGSHEIIPVSRKLSSDDDLEITVNRVASLISAPIDLKEGVSVKFTELDLLPRLGLALRRVWVLDRGQRKEIVIELRKSSILEEMKNFMKNRKKIEDRKERGELFIDLYFMVLTKSIFHLRPEVDRIDYLIDGKRGSIPGMNYDLSESRMRGETDGDNNGAKNREEKQGAEAGAGPVAVLSALQAR